MVGRCRTTSLLTTNISRPLPSNTRHNANQIFEKNIEHHPWFGLEQEYVLIDGHTNKPLGWPTDSTEPEPQGKYYCGVGYKTVFGREIITEHYQACLKAGIKIAGVNAEVLPGQWEFQIGPCVGIDAGDHLWMARYLLHRICEKHKVIASFEPKPVLGDWNGSGMHCNFSTEQMRYDGGIKYIENAISKLSKNHNEHIKVYGDNSKRLSGTHETSNIDNFTWGVGDRSASVRIPILVNDVGSGYFEDRRPASDADPYLVTSKIFETTL